MQLAGSGRGAARPAPIVDRYVLAKVEVNGSVHLGQMIEGVCFAICNYAQNPILLPVAEGEVECLQCLRLMRHKNLAVNMSVQFVEGKV